LGPSLSNIGEEETRLAKGGMQTASLKRGKNHCTKPVAEIHVSISKKGEEERTRKKGWIQGRKRQENEKRQNLG